ncbi:RNA-directed DNA polymerase, eukaryota [Tanacetum coccineum]
MLGTVMISNTIERRKAIQDKLFKLDKQLDQEGGQENLLNARRDLWKDLWVLDDLREKDLVQKAKVKWAIEGDENSTSPNRGLSFLNEELFPVSLNQSQQELLEVEVTDKEIKKAVWDCGRNKSPGPDGVSFKFVRKYWDVIGVDVCRAVNCLFRSGVFPKGCNPSFITLIPKLNDAKFVKDFRPISLIGWQILDGPLILSEVIDWCNQKKNKAMIFKVDFEKAYDSVKWDFLDMILHRFGFGEAWRAWIKGCLVSSSASILVNGSPTQEFYFEQGLRQGDPLSPFLFLLVMEALHLSFVHAMEGGFFKGILVGSHEPTPISHLFYADDAVFIGEWREENLRHLVSILQCFYLASGLRINIHKCSIMGVGGVTNDEVYRGAQMTGCEASKIPFKYLGIMVGSNMNRLHAWDRVIEKVMARLSKWKAKTLSIGGRFTLTKSVLSSIPLYYFSLFKVPIGVLKRLESCRSNFFRGVESGSRKVSWFSWDSVVASKDVGGLGMSSFLAMNCALLFKWIWWFKVQPDAMWVSIIKAIHGRSGSLDCGAKRTIKKFLLLKKSKMVSFMGLEDRQGGAERVQLEEVSKLIDSIELVEEQDKWVWNLEGDGVFKVASARRFIDEGLSEMEGVQTRWVKLVPIKVNVFAWRLAVNKLPTRFNMSSRGLEIPSIVCPVCNVGAETVDHLFFSCSVASSIMAKVLGWWGFLESGISSYHNWVSWFEGLRLKKVAKDYLEATIFVSWWVFWGYHNKLLFSSESLVKASLFDLIVSHSYIWCNSRARRKLDWVGWLKSPIL